MLKTTGVPKDFSKISLAAEMEEASSLREEGLLGQEFKSKSKPQVLCSRRCLICWTGFWRRSREGYIAINKYNQFACLSRSLPRILTLCKILGEGSVWRNWEPECRSCLKEQREGHRRRVGRSVKSWLGKGRRSVDESGEQRPYKILCMRREQRSAKHSAVFFLETWKKEDRKR